VRVAPLIHTRTFSLDFNSEFMVRPNCFLDIDIKWARKYILNATGEIDNIKGERWVVIDNEKYRIAGVVGFLKNICEKCSLSEEDDKKSKTMFCDNKGRLVYAFIGIVFDKFDKNEDFGKITYDYLWRKYLECIFPVWKRTSQEVITKEFSKEELEPLTHINQMEDIETVGDKKFCETNPEYDYRRFQYFLGSSDNGFSYCSNLCDYNLINRCEFSVVSTSSNIITRFKKNLFPRKEDQLQNTSKMQSDCKSMEDMNTKNNDNGKKKALIILTSLFLMLIVIILILLLRKE